MPKTLTLELPDDAFSAFRQSPEEFGRELRLAAAIKWYEMERISQGKAAELAGLSRSAFIETLPIRGKYVTHFPRSMRTVRSRKQKTDVRNVFTYRYRGTG